ncbi:MAG TPA: chromate transporter [Treponemataceae bacterium]|jgi:chromate transporter|nr:chromate transporter [Treponemataceae bacterium]HQC27300.1 chromate transporter [Treponemataceae bacterium]
MSLWELFWVFFYVGLFTIGGGQVAITLMQQIFFSKNLISPERFFNMVAISESTPGPIGINMATYIGYEFYGVWGGVITTLGTVLPSIIIITIIASFFFKIQNKPLVQAAFNGLRPTVTGLIAVAAWLIFRVAVLDLASYAESKLFASLFDIKTIILYLVFLILFFKTKLHPVLFMVLGAVSGILILH